MRLNLFCLLAEPGVLHLTKLPLYCTPNHVESMFLGSKLLVITVDPLNDHRTCCLQEVNPVDSEAVEYICIFEGGPVRLWISKSDTSLMSGYVEPFECLDTLQTPEWFYLYVDGITMESRLYGDPVNIAAGLITAVISPAAICSTHGFSRTYIPPVFSY